MDRQTRRLFAIVLLAVLAAAGGAAYLLGGATNDPNGSATSPSVIGVVVGVRTEGLDAVRGFSVRTQDGFTVTFTLGDLEDGVAFPPGHLVEHQATAQRVRVWYVVERGENLAIRIEDAP